MRQIFIDLGVIGTVSSCLPIFLCLFFAKKSLNSLHWTLLLLALLYSIINVLSLVLFFDKKAIQEEFIRLYLIIEFVLISVFFIKYIHPKFFKRLSILGLFVFFVLCSGLYYYNLLSLTGTISLFSNIFLMIYSVYIVFNTYYQSLPDKPTNQGGILIVFSVLFYACVQFYFSVFDLVIRDDSMEIFYYLWPIFQIGTIIYYVSFTLGLWKLVK